MNLPKTPQQTPTPKIPQEKWEAMSEEDKQKVMEQIEAFQNFTAEGKSKEEVMNELFKMSLDNPEGEKVVQSFRKIVDVFINVGTTIFNLLIGLTISQMFEGLSLPWYTLAIISIVSSQIAYHLTMRWLKSQTDNFANATMGQKLGFQEFMAAFLTIPFANILTILILILIQNMT